MRMRLMMVLILPFLILAQIESAIAACPVYLPPRNPGTDFLVGLRNWFTLSPCFAVGGDRTRFFSVAYDNNLTDAGGHEIDPRLHYIETFRGRPALCAAAPYNVGPFEKVMDAYEATLQQANPRPLLLHMHGGLVAGVGGFAGARVLMCEFYSQNRCGAAPGDFPKDTPTPPPSQFEKLNAFPVFVVWNSGLAQAWHESIWRSHPRESSPHGIVTRSANRFDIESDMEASNVSHGTCMDPIERRFRTYNYAVAPSLWHFMEDEIADSFSLDGNAEPTDQAIDHSDRVGLWLVQRLAQLRSRYGDKVKVLLVGHSMGSEYASWFIEAYDQYIAANHISEAEKMKFDVIFLAPAVPYTTFERVLRTGRIRHFRMFTMDDTNEKADDLTAFGILDTLTGPAYPRSLLYFISGVLNPVPDFPVLGLQRYFDAVHHSYYKQNLLIDDVTTWMKKIKYSRVWSRTSTLAPFGMRTESCHHGGFDTDPYTVQSIVYIVNHAWQPPNNSSVDLGNDLEADLCNSQKRTNAADP